MPGRSLILTYVVPAVGLAAFAFGAYTVLGSTPERAAEAPTFAPPSRPATTGQIGGIGTIEPQGEAISIGAHRAGIVEAVLVDAGQVVEAGAPLFRIDQRLARETAALQRAQLEREVARLEELRRQVAVTAARLERAVAQQATAEAQVDAAIAQRDGAEAEAMDRQQRATRSRTLLSSDTIAEEEADSLRLQSERAAALLVGAESTITAARAAVVAARAEVNQLRGELALLADTSTTPATDGPLLVAQQATVEAARASLRAAEVELDYLTVTAPRRATVLRVNVRAGEYVAPGLSSVAPMILGDVDPLHVRVRIDEADAMRLDPTMTATASPRGDASRRHALEYVRTEPLLVPKRSLAGASTEFVDTQVMELIFAIPPAEGPALQPGMRMDVYIKATGAP